VLDELLSARLLDCSPRFPAAFRKLRWVDYWRCYPRRSKCRNSAGYGRIIPGRNRAPALPPDQGWRESSQLIGNPQDFWRVVRGRGADM